jgi:hypothetical protein
MPSASPIVQLSAGGGMFKRLLIFAASVLLFVAGIWLLSTLSNVPSIKDKKAQAKILLEEKALSQTFDVIVMQSGFRKRTSGQRDVYVPCLLVRAVNISSLASKPATLEAEFLKSGRTFCRAMGIVPSLKPGENWEVWLKCIDSVGFGSVAWGISLAETTEGMDYELYLGSGGVSIVIVKDKLKSFLQ